mmetsp:Transcript_22320/g.69038  ORF Transcript_22320/g.69038 Transcript_22320/m.69038 type:complete len:273 (-) Transcript_22320:1041-1859(-)
MRGGACAIAPCECIRCCCAAPCCSIRASARARASGAVSAVVGCVGYGRPPPWPCRPLCAPHAECERRIAVACGGAECSPLLPTPATPPAELSAPPNGRVRVGTGSDSTLLAPKARRGGKRSCCRSLSATSPSAPKSRSPEASPALQTDVGESIDAPVSCEEVDDGTTAAVSCDEAPSPCPSAAVRSPSEGGDGDDRDGKEVGRCRGAHSGCACVAGAGGVGTPSSAATKAGCCCRGGGVGGESPSASSPPSAALSACSSCCCCCCCSACWQA